MALARIPTPDGPRWVVRADGTSRALPVGLDELLGRARTDPWAATVMMAGGGLRPDDVPWLARAGIAAFHIGSAARPGGSYKAYVDEGLVRSWRNLVDAEVRHRAG